MSREKEVQKLCELILETPAEAFYGDYDKEHWFCPFCCAKEYDQKKARMSLIKHHPDCEYSIAKGLMTGIIAT